jgi:hypothetical protein
LASNRKTVGRLPISCGALRQRDTACVRMDSLGSTGRRIQIDDVLAALRRSGVPEAEVKPLS